MLIRGTYPIRWPNLFGLKMSSVVLLVLVAGCVILVFPAAVGVLFYAALFTNIFASHACGACSGRVSVLWLDTLT